MWNTDELSPDEREILMQNAADDADAERASREIMDREAWLAEQHATDEDAERWAATADPAIETDLW